jgi:hypothetical protein
LLTLTYSTTDAGCPKAGAEHLMAETQLKLISDP